MPNMTTVIVGAGHCGLAMSHCVAARSIDHVALERGAVANSWRTQRWDSLLHLFGCGDDQVTQLIARLSASLDRAGPGHPQRPNRLHRWPGHRRPAIGET